jgi:hypothetical protein
MLPAKVQELIKSLRDKTESGELQWNYNDDDSTVSLDQDKYWISVRYSFNTTEEVGQFQIIYFDKETQKQHYFLTTEEYRDYELARRLFDSAQASGLNFYL